MIFETHLFNNSSYMGDGDCGRLVIHNDGQIFDCAMVLDTEVLRRLLTNRSNR